MMACPHPFPELMMAFKHPDPLDYTRPSVSELKRLVRLQAAWFDPQFFGLENIDATRPALYVGNHTLMAIFDGPLMLAGLYEHTGVYLRSLADHFHFRLPGWREALVRFGGVEGTRENCARLMAAGENILVYPGGAREVMKNRGEDYQLIWKQRTGFAAMAMEYGYDIVPFAALGADETYDIVYDASDFRASLLGRALDKTGLMKKYLRGGEMFSPIVRGVFGTPLPRPEKLYFHFGERIPTAPWQDRHGDKNAQWEVRTLVEDAIYSGLGELVVRRHQDADWPAWRRRLGAGQG
jgi:1-acyl-sn-glycerol-3-phosphate acyltransferase